jgi:ribulose-phosphate 3-epimerase
MMEVIPSILAKTKEELETMVRNLEPHVERAHLDIMDGEFVPNKTIKGYDELKDLKTSLRFDVHLMIKNPHNIMHRWYKAGNIDAFMVHAEEQNGLRELIDQIKLNRKKVGLVLNPSTQIGQVIDFLDDVDYVQFMTVEPGFYGGKFVEKVVAKIEDFYSRYPKMPIMVDGGVNPETAKRLKIAGVSILVVGSYIQKSPDIQDAIQTLKYI